MRDHDDTAAKVIGYVDRQAFPVSVPMVAERLHINHGKATDVASKQIALGLWRRADDGRVMGINCHLHIDWTDDITNHMDAGLLDICMSKRDLIDIWRSGAWLATADIHELTGIPSDRIKNAFSRGRLPYRMILDKRHATYADVLAWAHSVS